MKEQLCLKWHRWGKKFYIFNILNRIINNCDIDPTVKIGEGTRLQRNGRGITMDRCTKIGKNCVIYPYVIFDYYDMKYTPCVVGDNVTINSYCFIRGNIPSNSKVYPQNPIIVKGEKKYGTKSYVHAESMGLVE